MTSYDNTPPCPPPSDAAAAENSGAAEIIPPARVVLVRHGQTDWNAEHCFQGQTDIPLNDTGRQQAQLAAENLTAYAEQVRADEPEFRWDSVVTSPLSRANETGAIIAEALGLSVDGTYDGMKERFFGTAEGVQVTRDNWQSMDEHFENIEPMEQLRARGVAALNTALTEHRGQNLIIVAHGMWIAQVLEELTGETHAIPQNAAVTELPLHLLQHETSED